MKIIFLIAFSSLVMSSCSSYQTSTNKTSATQTQESHITAYLWHWDHITLHEPTVNSIFNRESLRAFVKPMEKHKAVVILDRQVELPGRRVAPSHVVNEFHAMGYQHVVVKLGTDEELPVLLESTK